MFISYEGKRVMALLDDLLRYIGAGTISDLRALCFISCTFVEFSG